MDMKKILQAFDGASTKKPVEGSNDMKKFLQILEGKGPLNRLTTAEAMAVQTYTAPEPRKTITSPVLNVAKDAKPSMVGKYFKAVEVEFAESAERKKEMARQLAERVIERVLPGQETPPGINRLTGKSVEPETEPTLTPPATQPLSSRFDPRFKNGPEPYSIDIDGKIYKFAGRDKQGPGTGEVIKVPAAVIGIRGLGAVNVELGADGMYYPAPKKVDEAPIAATDDPNNPMIHGHEKANPMTLKGRIMQARAQLRDLADMAESDDLATWQQITKLAKGGMFMGLEQNLEQIRHGISELAAKRKKGGVSSRGIDKNID